MRTARSRAAPAAEAAAPMRGAPGSATRSRRRSTDPSAEPACPVHRPADRPVRAQAARESAACVEEGLRPWFRFLAAAGRPLRKPAGALAPVPSAWARGRLGLPPPHRSACGTGSAGSVAPGASPPVSSGSKDLPPRPSARPPKSPAPLRGASARTPSEDLAARRARAPSASLPRAHGGGPGCDRPARRSSRARVGDQTAGPDEQGGDEGGPDAARGQASRGREARALRDSQIAGPLQQPGARLAVPGELLLLAGRCGERIRERRQRAGLAVTQLAQVVVEALPIASPVLPERREDGHYRLRPIVASVPRENAQRCRRKATPHPSATHCTQNRSGEKRRFRTAQVSRPEIITSAWMVSSVRWCSRTRNPLPGMRGFLPRKGEHRLPSGEVIEGAVADQNAEQGQTAAGTA